MRVALTGNPNSGKTTLFNAITGKVEKVGNWAGVTVEKKEGKVKKNLNQSGVEITAVDLPGAYSMSPFTSEENITREFVLQEAPDVIINIVDATNLSRSLFFTTQLLELGIPVVVALNKADSVKSKQIEINKEKLEEMLGCSVIFTVASGFKDNGLNELVNAVVQANGKTQKAPTELLNSSTATKEEAQSQDHKRYEFVNELVKAVEVRSVKSSSVTMQDKVDRVLAHKWLGIPIFAVVMWQVFKISQEQVGPMIADWLGGYIEQFYGIVETALAGVSPVLSAIVLEGIVNGVGAVVGFLPLIMVMFFLLALLEDCGYMARVAVVMDRFFKIIGLSGKSIIPMVIGTGCAIPGVMATRTIKDVRQRRTTAMLTPFIPCGAKIPVIALFSGVFFANASWVSTLMYFSGIVLIIVLAWVILKITGEKNKKTYFILELPEYRWPSLTRAAISMFSRAKAFIVKAATIIMLCNLAIYMMQTFNWSFEVVAEGAENTSILASIASPFALALLPLGFGTWQLAAAAITGFIAKENVVGTLAVVFGITNFISVDELALVSGANEVASVMGITSVAALAYLMFNLFTPPCFAAIGAMNAEIENRKWLWTGIGLQFGVGYVVAFCVYQIGTLITLGTVGTGFVPGLIVTIALIAILVLLVRKGEKKAELALSK